MFVIKITTTRIEVLRFLRVYVVRVRNKEKFQIILSKNFIKEFYQRILSINLIVFFRDMSLARQVLQRLRHELRIFSQKKYL